MRLYGFLTVVFAATWSSLWFTPDQQGQRLLNRGEHKAAAQIYSDPMRQGVAWFRAGEFEKAEQAFARQTSPIAEYNRGNSFVMLGKYELAIIHYDRALQLRSGWNEAQHNRDIALVRAKQLKQEGGDMGDQKVGADDIRFDKQKSGGKDTESEDVTQLSDADIQALWLRRVQTKAADFLKAKFAYQAAINDEQIK